MRIISAKSFSPTPKQHKSSLSISALLTIKETIEKGLETISMESKKMYFEIIYFASGILFEEIEKKCIQDHPSDPKDIKSKVSLILIREHAELGMVESDSEKCQQYFEVIQKNTNLLEELVTE